eukprot:TRINITY_DN7093_c0_g1_i4.p1 TRINITY_DN7093_c0_g1~~TRINITY_DN7093_c0_g1_i4.p1  ORF type:complete len:438 (-),score=17.29 TRINITY_DN7093_c0_g1_i4:518-1831(-)
MVFITSQLLASYLPMTDKSDVESSLLPTETKQVDRKGNWLYVSFTNCTALVGAGVLSLPWAFSNLGLFWGALTLTVAFIISFCSAFILSHLHEQEGQRFDQYTRLGQFVFGPIRGVWLTTPFQMATNIGTSIVYIITGAQSAQHVVRLLFPNREELALVYYIIVFALIQLMLVQLPDFHSLRWVSFGGAVMAVGYCSIAVVSSVMHAYDGSRSVNYGQRNTNLAGEFFGDCNAIGSILFSFGGMCTFLEIQAALPSPSQKSMLQGFSVSYVLALCLYFVVAVSGYLAFGSVVNENILISVAKPKWVIALANGMVFLHVVAGYQVYSMPVFELFQNTIGKKWAERPCLRFSYRAVYVFVGAVIATCLPFFAAMNGLVGSIGMGMITFVLPFVMAFCYWNKQLNAVFKLLIVLIVVTMIILAGMGATGALYNIVLKLEL